MSDAPLAVRFVLSNNLPTSVTRLTADAAKELVALGTRVTVCFPVIDWLDFKLFQIGRLTGLTKLKWLIRLVLEGAWKLVTRRRWCGFHYYRLDPRVKAVRYLVTPPLGSPQDRDVAVVHHAYVIPHMLRAVPTPDLRIVSVVHNNYELEMHSASPDGAAWSAHVVAMEQRIAVPRYAGSYRAGEVAERLGIPIHRVIPGGIDLQLFYPAPSLRDGQTLRVLVFCDQRPQKGQRIAAEALRQLRLGPRSDGVRFCSIGRVAPEYEALFDVHYGFLHRAAYARALQEGDIFVYPSLFDGFPAPPLQAMACGIAVVTTLVEGVEEYAVDGENCLTCPPGDTQALGAQLLRLIQDPALRARLQAHGPKTAQAYSVQRCARNLLEFLEEVADGKVTGRTVEAWKRPSEAVVA